MPDRDTGLLSVLPYVPHLLSSWQPTHGDDRHMQVEGSLAFVDISGFTRLTERLARKGNVGAEEMSDLLDATFSALLRDAWAEGADLVKWGGDAVLLLYSGPDHAARACGAAYDMRATLRSIGTLRTSSGTVTLRMSVGVHSGAFDFYLVGDPAHHRELLVVGPEASLTAEMESVASAGQVAVSDRTAALLPARATRPGPVEGAWLLRSRPGPARALPAQQRGTAADERLLQQYLPAVLRQQVLAEQGEAEHRSVAVAFVRFSGTDELARTGGTTAVAEGLDQCVRNVQQATAEHDVTFFETDIDRDGGKIMLVAGAPRSSGRDEERMLRAVRTVMDRAGVLRLRIGVNRGNVFAGDFGPTFRRTYSIKGDAVNLAARVMSRATDGEVLATAATLERSPTRFETRELEPFLVKGKAKPVTAARVGAVLGSAESRRTASPFVGRTGELAQLRAALEGAVRGTGGEVEVVGEPGIGKSRLVGELLATAPDVLVLSGSGGQYDATTPYFPFRGVLRSALGLRRDTGAEETAERLRTTVSARAPELLPWLPLLAVPLDLEVDPTQESSELDAQYRKARLEESVEHLLSRLTAGPVVLVVEDAHLLDEASCDLLARLARRAPERPWLVVVTRREDAGGYAPAGEQLVSLRLEPLPPEQSLQLARATAVVPMTHEAATAVSARSGGNPMFLEELVATAGRLGSVADLPESVQDLVTSQIDRLSPVDRLVLRCAAVLGTVADLEVLEQLLATYRDDVQLLDHLPALAGFLDPSGSGRVRFRHALMRDVAYEGLPYRRRRLLHAHVGEVLERSADDPEQVSELLSLHFFHAGLFDRAWEWSRVAAARAQEKYAHSEAVELLQRAVEAARRSPEVVDGRQLADVLESLGDVRYVAGRSEAAVEAYRTATQRRSGDPVGVAHLQFKSARTLQRLGRLPQSLGLLRRSLASLEGVRGSAAHAARAELATRYAWGRLRQGRYADALRWATVAAREAESSADRATLALAYNGLHSAHYYAGRPEDVPYARLALMAYEELGDLAGQAHCANNLGVEALDAGRMAESAAFFGRAQSTFRRLGDEANQANATYNQADVLLREGRYGEAEPLLQDALGIARAVGDEELVALVLRETGQLCLRLGRREEALAHLADARARLTALGLAQELAALDEAEREALALGLVEEPA